MRWSMRTSHSRRSRSESTAGEVLKILQKEKDRRDKEFSDRLRAVMEFKEKNEALVFQTTQGQHHPQSAWSDCLRP